MSRGAGVRVTIDESGLIPLLKGLGRVEKDLRDRSNGRLRDAANLASNQLVRELQSAAGAAATPQARLLASTVKVKRDRLVAVTIGGRTRVGHRGTAAGALLWGSEHGGENFVAPAGGNYWIAPTVERFRDGAAQRAYLLAVSNILRDAGLL